VKCKLAKKGQRGKGYLLDTSKKINRGATKKQKIKTANTESSDKNVVQKRRKKTRSTNLSKQARFTGERKKTAGDSCEKKNLNGVKEKKRTTT